MPHSPSSSAVDPAMRPLVTPPVCKEPDCLGPAPAPEGTPSPSRWAGVGKNLLLLAVGSCLFAVGFNGFAVPHRLLSGGVSGVSMLLYYVMDGLSPAAWYAILNVPLYVVGWLGVGRRFFWYSLAGAGIFTLALEFVTPHIVLGEPMLAVLAGGALMGAGAGVALHSMGSLGGTDIIAILLYQKYNLPMGRFSFLVNGCILTAGLVTLSLEGVLYSLAMLYVYAASLEYFLGVFNQRKMALVISDQHEAIARAITSSLRRGCTLLDGEGGYTHSPKRVVLAVVNTIQLKRLEELVYSLDPRAFMIVLSTATVLGEGFLRRKKYD